MAYFTSAAVIGARRFYVAKAILFKLKPRRRVNDAPTFLASKSASECLCRCCCWCWCWCCATNCCQQLFDSFPNFIATSNYKKLPFGHTSGCQMSRSSFKTEKITQYFKNRQIKQQLNERSLNATPLMIADCIMGKRRIKLNSKTAFFIYFTLFKQKATIYFFYIVWFFVFACDGNDDL